MNLDCGFQKEGRWFRYRTGALLVHDGKMPFVKSKIGDYYYMMGGAVGLGESSADCIKREVYEELGVKVKIERLALVCENFFKGRGGKIEGLDCHTIEFYYILSPEQDDTGFCKTHTDIGESIVWLTAEEVKENLIKPEFVRERIDEILNGKTILHIVEERDR